MSDQIPLQSQSLSPSQTQASSHKRNRQLDPPSGIISPTDDSSTDVIAKKPRDDSLDFTVDECSRQSIDDDCDDDDDDDYEDIDNPSDNDDFLDDFEDDQSTVSVSTTISTCSSVCSNTPSLVGENLESFSLGETEFKSGPSQPWIGGPVVRSSINPLRRSLFSNVPPYINFVHHNEVPEIELPTELGNELRWRLSNITPAIVKRVVTNSGFRLTRKTTTEWCGTWGKHMKSHMFKDIHEAQKINHYPGTFNIGRKDRLWKNYNRLRLKHGKAEFSFLPRTFCLPSETRLLKKAWEKCGSRAKWIVKPPASARGTGITVINKWSQIPKERPLIVQKYVAKPHLINNTKYDLRIYVLVTSMCPLTIYLYDEGLVRFASKAYTTDNSSLSDVFTHLTNYSINKNSSTYLPNEDSEVRQGHKWTLGLLWSYLIEQGIDPKPIQDSIKDLVIKTIISSEHAVYPLYRANMNSHYVGYELFGFDILLDSKLKPWLIEVNISPSLHSTSPLDLDVKSPLTTEVFNLAGFHVPQAKVPAKVQTEILEKLNMSEKTNLCLDRRLYARELSRADRSKQDKFTNMPRPEYLEAILEKLTADDVRFLVRMEDEFAQASHFARIFPTPKTHKYFKLLDQPRYYNLLVDAWETKYSDCRGAAIDRLEILCQEKVHLKVATPNAKLKKKSQIVDVSVLKAPTGNAPEIPAKLAEEPEKPKQTVKVSKITVSAKPHNVKSSTLPSSNRRSLQNQDDEKMSIEGDNSGTASPECNKTADFIDNENFCNRDKSSTVDFYLDNQNQMNANNMADNSNIF